MNSTLFFGNFGKAAVACALCGALGASGQITLNLNVGGATDTINKSLYGTSMENWGRGIYNGVFVGTGSSIPNTNGMRNDVIAGFKEAGICCIKFPGGCGADYYDWRNGIGMPQSSRPGGEMQNGLGTPEFFKLCSLTTALSAITANFRSDSSSGINAWLDTIEQHSAWKTAIKYWKIGFEEWWGVCGNNMTQPQYQTKFDQWYDAEPSWAASGLMHIMDGGPPEGSWARADCQYAVNNSGPMGISYHYFAVPDWGNLGTSYNFNDSQYYARLRSAWALEGNISGLESTMNGYDPGCKVGLCVDEWGAWYDDVYGEGAHFNWSTMRDAVIAGTSLNIFNNHCRRVKMACVHEAVNVHQALMLTDSSDQTRMRKTPVFWVFKMYKPNQGARMVPVSWANNPTNQGIPVLNASASYRVRQPFFDDSLIINLVNTHAANSQSLTIYLKNLPSYIKMAHGMYGSCFCARNGQIVNGNSIRSGITSFTATDTASLQTFTNFSLSDTTITAVLPPHSIVKLVFFGVPMQVSVPEAIRTADRYFIKSAGRGSIVVNYTVSRKTPVRLELYGIDGRTIVESFNGAAEPGGKGLVWRPKNRDVGTNVYIVKLTAGGVTKSQRVVLGR